MTISPPEREAKSKIVVDRDPVETSFEKWAKPGISHVLQKVQQQLIGISTLMHMISMHTTDLEDISRKVLVLTSAN
jgi:photosystem I P700 chlorophyll a apoprotein A1